MIHLEVCIKGKIDPSWSDWFESMDICQSEPEGSWLIGNVPDQAAVYGVLSRLSGLGLWLVSVTCSEVMNLANSDNSKTLDMRHEADEQ